MTESAEPDHYPPGAPGLDFQAGIRYLFRDAARNFIAGLRVARRRRKGLMSHDEFVAAIDRIFPTDSTQPN
jgi:hypothetical protein